MDNLEIIEAYFNNELTQERKGEFDRRVISDPVFAEEVAFYLSSKQSALGELDENRSRLKELYENYKQGNPADSSPRQAFLRQLWPWAAAAAVLVGIIFGWYTWFKPVSLPSMADKYIKENFQNLPVMMDNREDSLQTGVRLYNEGREEEALKYFESMILRDSLQSEVKEYAGIVSLRLGEYDKAINYFSQLSDLTLQVNPGKFYHALTLMKRNQPGDMEMAKQLLQQVIENNLEGNQYAERWLRKW